MLAAIGIDPNNSQYSIAYAIVQKENSDSWTWFLRILVEDIQIERLAAFIIMSDKKGLENVLATILEGVEIKFCVRHLHANFKKYYPGLLLKQMLWACARATTLVKFKRKLNELKDVDEKAYKWLLKKTPTEWSKSHFRESVKCDMLLNNLCESFNVTILHARVMCRFQTNMKVVKKMDTPNW